MLQVWQSLVDNRNMLAIVNKIECQILTALNAEDRFAWLPADRQWIRASTHYKSKILYRIEGPEIELIFTTSGHCEVTCLRRFNCTELCEIVRYAERCEQAVARLDAGETLVQRRDIDDVLGACAPEFRKTDAFRRLDDALSARE